MAALTNMNEELIREREFLASLKKQNKGMMGGRSTADLDSSSFSDISVDNPIISPTKGEDEVIGNDLIMDLKQNLET